MSAPWWSISLAPSVSSSASMRPTPGASLIHTAAADHSPRTSGVSPTSATRRLRVGQQCGEHLLGVLPLLGEVLLGEGEAGGGGLAGMVADGRDLLGQVEERAVGVGADLQVGAALALVHQAVHVAQQREA